MARVARYSAMSTSGRLAAGAGSLRRAACALVPVQVGMRYFHFSKNKYHCPVINLDKIWTLVGEEARLAAAKDTSSAPVIDVTQHGYFKVLGKGELPAQPLVVRAKFVSKLAESKIKEVGGAVQLVA